VRKLQSQGVHHITLVGAGRRTSIDFWEGVLGMPFVFEQPNLDNDSESHLYFDPGDGRLITVFTNEERERDVERGDYNIAPIHVADAIEALAARSQDSLSDDRSPTDPYR
jgi:catechol 2,3-dioxygenase-like lactoylglutathione lyase family enzyme